MIGSRGGKANPGHCARLDQLPDLLDDQHFAQAPKRVAGPAAGMGLLAAEPG